MRIEHFTLAWWLNNIRFETRNKCYFKTYMINKGGDQHMLQGSLIRSFLVRNYQFQAGNCSCVGWLSLSPPGSETHNLARLEER